MPDYDKIGREVRAILCAFPIEPETEEGKMVADLRYPGWREKCIVNVDTDESQSSDVARALGYSGEPSMLQTLQVEIAAHLTENGEDGAERLALMRALFRLLEKP